MTPERLEQLSIGYDLDGGGYAFEEAYEGIGSGVVMWADPDWDYLPFERPQDYYSLSCPLIAFAPGGLHDFPDEFDDEDGDTYFKVAEFTCYGSDRECRCHGKLVEWTGAAGEPDKPVRGQTAIVWVCDHDVKVDPDTPKDSDLYFEHTGNTSDAPYPDCNRCEGSGYVDSEGGTWALYAIKPDDEDD